MCFAFRDLGNAQRIVQNDWQPTNKRKMYRYSILLIAFVCTIASCDSTVDQPEHLLAYVDDSALPMSDQLIACAGGGEPDQLNRPDDPISVYYYPIEGARNFKYFETESINLDPADLSLYQKINLEDTPLFNGYLRYFRNIPLTEERWARITYETSDSLHVSNAIRLKYPILPTEYDNSKVVVTQDGTNPTFSWADHQNDLDVIFFQVISDRNDNLISGTYTFDKTFTFYDLSNVVLNIRDVSPAPALEPQTSYKFTLMTVSSDNWVNLIAEQEFTTE